MHCSLIAQPMHLRRASYHSAGSALRAVLDGPMPARKTIRSIRPAWRAMPANACGLRQKSLTGYSFCGASMLPQADICRLTWIKPRCGQLCMDRFGDQEHTTLMAPRPKACSACAVRETAICRVLNTQQLARLNRRLLSARVSGGAADRRRGRVRGLVRDGALRRHQALQDPIGWPSADRRVAVSWRFSWSAVSRGISLHSRDCDRGSALLLRSRLL